VTDFAILTHENVKHPLVDPRLRPDLAVLDEALVEGLPGALVADGGYDAVSHALEAIAATASGAVTDALATAAFCDLLNHLPASFRKDMSARLPVHRAATMAGLAFTQSGLGMCHALSHSLGGMFHVPHGRLNAVLLPAVVGANTPWATEKYATLARRAGLGGSSDTMATRNLKNALIRLRRELKLPQTLPEAGIDPRLLQEKMDAIIAAALEDPCCRTNPRPVDGEVLRGVLQEVSHG
jgi:alcohol dehydrogenase class IV